MSEPAPELGPFACPPGINAVTPALRSAVESVRDQLGPHGVMLAAGWEAIAAELGLDPQVGTGPATFGVGRVPTLDQPAPGPTAPIAVLASGDDQATMRLWQAGWTPVTVHRMEVPVERARPRPGPRKGVELVVTLARPTPASPESSPPPT